ncbi:hypothetical protein [Dinoroseobacter sp. S375]|uniref:hypothetical protein n=1 Tax=Dinoroseobacter sp. S375 TaxID=3415136 RepID=UPI003C7E52E7
MIVLSLFDHSGIAVEPWAAAGHECLCFDKEHATFSSHGNVAFIPADLDPGAEGWTVVRAVLRRPGRKLVLGWPPCDDLTASGAKHFAKKAEKDPHFQARAVRRATLVAEEAEAAGAAWLVENPIGRLCTLWRKPDAIWDPFQFGGYLPEEEEHPEWPRYIAPRDAYTKKTGAWFGGGFVFPEARPVTPEILERETKSGRIIRGSRQFMRLGGSSRKTKLIRNLTPRGFARAVFEANMEARE